MLNSTVSSWRRQSKNQCGGGGCSSITGSPSSQTTGIRKHWRSFGLGARSILCIDAECYADDADRHTTITTAGADARAGGKLPARASCSNDAQTSHEEEANTSGSAWFEKTTKRLKRLHSEPGATAKLRKRKRGTCPGEGSQSYDEDLHHQMARLHLITTTTTRTRIQATPSTSGDALMGANTREEEEPCGALAPQEGEGGAGNEKGADACQWEALKRRVLYAEEHGSSPQDMGGGRDAERAMRDLRARIRQGWAEEVMRNERKGLKKKRRRDGGCWIREDGVLLQCSVT